MLSLICELCGWLQVLQEPQIDIACFLSAAIQIGWRNIDPEPISVTVYWDGSVDIELAGTCRDCLKAVARDIKTRRAA